MRRDNDDVIGVAPRALRRSATRSQCVRLFTERLTSTVLANAHARARRARASSGVRANPSDEHTGIRMTGGTTIL
jgi:hypothetical protein